MYFSQSLFIVFFILYKSNKLYNSSIDFSLFILLNFDLSSAENFSLIRMIGYVFLLFWMSEEFDFPVFLGSPHIPSMSSEIWNNIPNILQDIRDRLLQQNIECLDGYNDKRRELICEPLQNTRRPNTKYLFDKFIEEHPNIWSNTPKKKKKRKQKKNH